MRGEPQRSSPSTVSRRTMLALVPACVVSLAGCSAGDPSTAPTGPAAQPSGAGSPGADPTSSEPRFSVPASSVPVAGGALVSGVLVVQPIKGFFKAYDPRCPHMGAVVDPPVGDGVISCRAHGSQFMDLDGSVLQGPATRGLKEFATELDGDQVLVY